MNRLTAAILLATLCPLTHASAAEEKWYRGSTHIHAVVVHTSDKYTADVPTRWYSSHGYDFIVQTEHELVIDPTKIDVPPGFLLIAGQEISQLVRDETRPLGVRVGHVNGLGLQTAIMPMKGQDTSIVTPTMEQVKAAAAPVTLTQAYQRNFDLIRRQGGLPQLNHPNGLWSVRPADILPLEGPYLLEIWNGTPLQVNNLGGVSDTGEVSLSTEQLWDTVLSSGQIVWGVGSDDAHDYVHFDNPFAPTPGRAWIEVRAEALTRDKILDALRAGNFYASNGVYLKDITVTKDFITLQIGFPPADTGFGSHQERFRTTFVGKNGRILKESTGTSVVYRFQGDETYVRAVITDSDGRKAWTQPVFLDNRKDSSPYR